MKIFLAGTSAPLAKHPEYLSKSRFLLESFYYIKPWQVPYFLRAEDFMLDSGAFSYLFGVKKSHITDEYVIRYANFVKDYNIKKFIEFDIEEVFGWDEYYRLNNLLVSITNRDPIPVLHRSCGLGWWKKQVRNHEWVAIGKMSDRQLNLNDIAFAAYNQLIQIAHDNGAKVHGLGFTRTSVLDQVHFDSVDSATWAIAGTLGSAAYFGKNNKMRQWNCVSKGLKVKNVGELQLFSYDEWLKYQEYAYKNL